MPTYKNRLPLPPDTQVWHYTKLKAVIAMWRNQQMRLTRLDTFKDQFEGSVPKKQIDDQLPLFAGGQGLAMMMQHAAVHYSGTAVSYRDPWGDTTIRRQAMRRSAHAICWSRGDESQAMWKLCCKDGKFGQMLALRSTLAKLKESVDYENVFVNPVNYRFYHKGDAFNDELDPLMHKRMGFTHEQEVRVVMYDEAHYHMLSRSLIENPAEPPPHELGKYRFLDWSPATCVEAIAISPYATKADESAARSAIAKLDPKVPIELSVLSERRYAPQF